MSPCWWTVTRSRSRTPTRSSSRPRGSRRAMSSRYYLDVAGCALPHLRRRPFHMKRFPNGVEGEFFHQKRVPGKASGVRRRGAGVVPERPLDGIRDRRQRRRARLGREPRLHRAAHVAFARARDRAARLPADRPRPERRGPVAVRAGDRARRAGGDGRARASLVPEDLRRDRAAHPRADQARAAVSGGAPVRKGARRGGRAADRRPAVATTTWRVADRIGVFVDFGQNARDRTIACAYSVRPVPDARVSAPLALGRGRRRRSGRVHASRRCAPGSRRSATRRAGCGGGRSRLGRGFGSSGSQPAAT